MNINNEFERNDIHIISDVSISKASAEAVVVFMSANFDIEQKFGIKDAEMLTMCVEYNPFYDTLEIQCEVFADDCASYFNYNPTLSEANIIKNMIAEKLDATHGKTPRQFCNDVQLCYGLLASDN